MKRRTTVVVGAVVLGLAGAGYVALRRDQHR